MVKLSKSRLKSLQKNFEGKRIAVIGDMMLDCYFWGEVKRVSPEAPVPVVEIENEFYRFGGAANVALNIMKLGGVPVPIGVIGFDNFGTIFTSLIRESGMNHEGILIDDSRPTTAKTRVIAQNQHVVRIDKESKHYVDSTVLEELIVYLNEQIQTLDAIILQDYNKGMLTPHLIQSVISIAGNNKVLITADPKFHNFFKYKGVTVFKPNRKEAEDVLGIKIKTAEDISAAGIELLRRLKPEYLLLTLGEEGIAVFQDGEEEKRMPTKARRVADVSGAGDTVISTLTLALAAGADILEASFLANYAGGIVCEEVGIVPIDKEKLFTTIADNQL